MNEIPTLSREEHWLADTVATIPVMASTYILFAPPQGSSSLRSELNSATITLVELNGRQMGITAQHVIERYRQRCATGEQLVLYVGNEVIDLNKCLVSESSFLDLAVLDLKGCDSVHIRGDSTISCMFHAPRSWPPENVNPGEFVLLAGWPGCSRQELEPGLLRFASFSSGGTEVQSVQPDVITCRLELDECLVIYDREGQGAPNLPGISGGPMFRKTDIKGGLSIFELVAIVFEYQEALDVLRARPVSLISEDGLIMSE